MRMRIDIMERTIKVIVPLLKTKRPVR